MAAYLREELGYLDIEWFGVDRNGRIGCFATGGDGSVPGSIFRNKDQNEAMSALVSELPLDFAWIRLGALPEQWNFIDGDALFWKTHKSLAQKGIYSFERLSRDVSGKITYLCVAAPLDQALGLDAVEIKMPFLRETIFENIAFSLGCQFSPAVV